jgi:hypothetical protein
VAATHAEEAAMAGYRTALLVTLLGLTLTACATTTSSTYAKPGYVTEVKDGRLWVFREGSPEIKEFRENGELTKMVTRVGAGPNGMTIRAGDAKVIDDYLVAR